MKKMISNGALNAVASVRALALTVQRKMPLEEIVRKTHTQVYQAIWRGFMVKDFPLGETTEISNRKACIIKSVY